MKAGARPALTSGVRWARILAIGLALSASAASAEPPRTNAAVTLRKKPGEKQPAVGKLAAGTPVVIEAEAGRWLRVRAGKVTGYLTRTNLTLPAAAPVTSGAWGDKAPELDAAAAAPAEPTDVGVAAAPAVERVQEPLVLHVDLGIGYRSLGHDFSSNSSAGLANYLVSADAAAASLLVDGSWHRGKIVIGGDGETSGSTSSPGIEYMGPSAPSGKIPFRTALVRGGVRAGATFNAFEIALRGGLHYDAFLARDVENVGKLPRERLLGATVGVRADIVPPATRVSVALRFDVLAYGTRAQTPGLEDGESSTARALWAGATIRIALAQHLGIMFAYDFGRASTHWSGASIREPGVSDARRVDSSQLIQIGVSAGL